MKKQILKIATALEKRKEILGSLFSFTVNYEDVIANYRKRVLTGGFTDTIKDAMEDFKQVSSFSLSVHLDRGMNLDSEDENEMFSEDWKSMKIIFHMGKLDDNEELEKMDYLEYCKFILNTSGRRESINTEEKLYEINQKDGKVIPRNYFKYDEVEKIIDLAIQLDEVLDENYKRVKRILDELKCKDV